MKKNESVTPFFLTPQEMYEASLYFGVHLPPRYQKRYEALRNEKIRARREELTSEDWETRCFPK